MSEIKAFKGDYLGFTYNGVHSSTLGIVRTSDGSRFNENLLPTMQDKTVQVPGGDGTYYFGSYYTQRPFNISFAFDSLTEQQVAELKTHFGDKKIHELIFDETPYKVYRAKVTGTATIKYIPFNEGEGRERIYKGEGTIQFTCYFPFAKSKYKCLNDSSDLNKEEWKGASRMKDSNLDYNIYNNGIIKLYNPGDLEADFLLTLKFNETTKKIPSTTIGLVKNTENKLAWQEITAQGYDTHLIINTKLNLIEGYEQKTENNKHILRKSGNIYNKYITGGFFFKIPTGEEELTCPDLQEAAPSIAYDYYYF